MVIAAEAVVQWDLMVSVVGVWMLMSASEILVLKENNVETRREDIRATVQGKNNLLNITFSWK